MNKSQFQQHFEFPLDDFQIEAMQAIEDNRNVIVCAPTGSGKTAVAEYAAIRAIEEGRRCFYTTPLKALSNQKYHDFRQMFGDEKVGLLTGDVTMQREASILVMTTEVYRNMLYGTSLGAVERSLHGVQSVILDECHYMNDPDRGTVWEESVIYSPREVQLIALSATIANSDDLANWISYTHSETSLIKSDYRPVPLKHYYFFKGNLNPLVGPDGHFNPKLKTAVVQKMVVKRQVKQRRAPEHDCTPDAVVLELQRRDMLPAIYFVFSRRGCELAMQSCGQKINLLMGEEDQLTDLIDGAVAETPSLATNPHLSYLYQGIAVHHAGLLPAWKAVVEKLFQKGLIKVVFATETLAAGINMPARTTVISCLSKYTGDGHRLLRASEFLQMAGRAGRRGMDKVGHVVMVHHPKEPVQAAFKLSRAEADPLESNFRPSYGMVLNLLQRYKIDQCRELVERSFGQFLLSRAAESPRYRALLEEYTEVSQAICPRELGDPVAYKRLHEKSQSLLRQSHDLGKAPKSAAVRREIERLREHRDDIRYDMEGMPCHECEVASPCAERRQRLIHIDNALRREYPSRGSVATPYWRQFESLVAVLQDLGYLKGHKPTELGEMAAALRASNILVLAEVVRHDLLSMLDPGQLAAVLSTLVNDESRALEQVTLKPSKLVRDLIHEIHPVIEKLRRLQTRYKLEFPTTIVTGFAGIVERWATGWSWDEIRDASGMESGDLVRAFRRTIDVSRQIAYAPRCPQALASICRQVEMALSRDELKESLSNLELGFDV